MHVVVRQLNADLRVFEERLDINRWIEERPGELIVRNADVIVLTVGRTQAMLFSLIFCDILGLLRFGSVVGSELISWNAVQRVVLLLLIIAHIVTVAIHVDIIRSPCVQKLTIIAINCRI